jgi:hypothetical protein
MSMLNFISKKLISEVYKEFLSFIREVQQIGKN